MGALVNYVMTSHVPRPSNINFGLIPSVELKRMPKTTRKQKKSAKKDIKIYFEKTKKVIIENINDTLSQNHLILTLDSQMTSFENLAQKINSFNVEDSKVLINKNSKEEEFKVFFKTMNQIRKEGFDQIVKFHFRAKENCSEESFEKIINAYSDDITLTPR